MAPIIEIHTHRFVASGAHTRPAVGEVIPMSFFYEFEWDRSRASANLLKHEVDFKSAATVFKDPLAATIFDQ